MNKILSIVIPTHNRAAYAKYSILSILNLNLDIQLVVSDTSHDTELSDFVASIDRDKYPEIDFIYAYNPGAYDMKGNHNFALSLADAEFVCLIGDDDSITPFIIYACQWMQRNNVSVLSQLVSANYVWPDFVTRFLGKSHAGRLYIKKGLDQLQKLSSHDAFLSALQNAAQGTDGLPKLYHGIVKRSLLDQVCIKSGTFVHGASPDLSMAIALATVCDDFYQTTFPITIPGASGGSNTGRSALNKHKGNLSDEGQTKNDQATWESEIPPFFAVETVWADACFKTLDSLNVDFKKDFDFIHFYSLLLLNHWERRTQTLLCIDNYFTTNKLSKFVGGGHIFLNISRLLMAKVLRLGKRLLHPSAANGQHYYSNLSTVENTPNIVFSHVKEHNIKNIFLD